MNAVIEVIKNRRSVRSYLDKPVPKEVIDAIIDAGNWAPTGNNEQNWRFVVVQDRGFMQTLINAAFPVWKAVIDAWLKIEDDYTRRYFTDFWPRCLGWPYQTYEETMKRARDYETGIYWDAPVIIFVIGHHVEECSLVRQNMMIAAQSLGLGSCIVGFGAQVTSDPNVVEMLELKENEKMWAPVVFGYPKIVPESPPKRAPVVKWI
jgi:nitroreductase